MANARNRVGVRMERHGLLLPGFFCPVWLALNRTYYEAAEIDCKQALDALLENHAAASHTAIFPDLDCQPDLNSFQLFR